MWCTLALIGLVHTGIDLWMLKPEESLWLMELLPAIYSQQLLASDHYKAILYHFFILMCTPPLASSVTSP